MIGLLPFLCLLVYHVRVGLASGECETISIPMCQDIGYNFTRLPNQFNHESQEEAGLEVHQFWPLVKIECSPDLRFFLCSMYAPICISTYSHPLPACRSVCQRARLGCLPVMQKYGFEWPARMDCSRLPEYGGAQLCMDQQAKGQPPTGLPPSSPWPAAPQAPAGEAPCQCQACGRGNSLVPLLPGDAGHNRSISWASHHDCASPCLSPFFTSEDRHFTQLWLSVWSTLCCLSTALTFSTFLLNPSRFSYPERPIMYLSLCYLLLGTGYLVRITAGHQAVSCQLQRPGLAPSPDNRLMSRQGEPHQGNPGDSLLCTLVFTLTYFFYMAASVWWVILTATWFLSAGLKWAQEAIARYSVWYHCVAWTLPMVQTLAVLLLAAVEGDPVTGLCQVTSRDPALLGGLLLLPLLLYLLLGVSFLCAGFIALFKIRSVIKEQGGRTKIDKLEKLMVKIGIFSVLYIVPAGTVIACGLYEASSWPGWEHSLLCPSCTPDQDRTSPDFSVLMLKHFMILAVGLTSGFWVWSSKTAEAWGGLVASLCRLTAPFKHQTGGQSGVVGKAGDRCSQPLPPPPTHQRVESSLVGGNIYSTIPHKARPSHV